MINELRVNPIKAFLLMTRPYSVEEVLIGFTAILSVGIQGGLSSKMRQQEVER